MGQTRRSDASGCKTPVHGRLGRTATRDSPAPTFATKRSAWASRVISTRGRTTALRTAEQLNVQDPVAGGPRSGLGLARAVLPGDGAGGSAGVSSSCFSPDAAPCVQTPVPPAAAAPWPLQTAARRGQAVSRLHRSRSPGPRGASELPPPLGFTARCPLEGRAAVCPIGVQASVLRGRTGSPRVLSFPYRHRCPESLGHKHPGSPGKCMVHRKLDVAA